MSTAQERSATQLDIPSSVIVLRLSQAAVLRGGEARRHAADGEYDWREVVEAARK